MLVKIEIDLEDLIKLVQERDDLLSRIRRLEDKPLAFSLRRLADHVVANANGLTQDQKDKIHRLIESESTER